MTHSSTTALPIAAKRPSERIHHGHTFVDDYEWLRAKDDPDTTAYLEAENAYAEKQLAPLEGLREEIFGEIKARTLETDMSVPSRQGHYWYFTRTTEGRQYPAICRVPASGGDWIPPAVTSGVALPAEQELLDCDVLAEGHPFFALATFSTTLDGRLTAYATDVVGDERYVIRIKDHDTGGLLADEIEGTSGAATWSADGRDLYYATVDESWRADRIWRHRLGADPADDVLIHHETDPRFSVAVTRTTSNRFLLLLIGSKITSEVRILDLDGPDGEFRIVAERRTGVEYDVEHVRLGETDRLAVLHNRDAENFSLGFGPITMSSLDELEVVIAASDAVRLSDIDASDHSLVVNLRRDGMAQVAVLALGPDRAGPPEPIAFDELIFDASALGFSDWAQPFVRLHYTSWVTPATIYEYDPATRDLQLRRQQPILGGYQPSDYVQTREWVEARDGAMVPLSIVHHKDVTPRRGAPLLLDGYGAYEASSDPYVSISRLSLLDRGVVVATAHVRGGGEMGRGWYEHGKLLEKKNTFTDFVDCAQHLVTTGWTSPPQLVAHGGSAGGLLIGAVVNMAPELFGAVVARVPFVDALTSMLDPSLPLTVVEWDEWGDPLHDAAVYDYMRSYTPYENISPRRYPAIYVRTSINDTRVLYVEPAKWVARLREVITNPGDVVFRCEMSAGHGGASGRYDAWREAADYLAWIVDKSGARHPRPHPLPNEE